ncbi:hypothetical protein H0H93_013671, partial [Arthromyces matolae]
MIESRSPSPPILHEPIVDSDDDSDDERDDNDHDNTNNQWGNLNWFYADYAGGRTITSGIYQYRGRKVNQLSFWAFHRSLDAYYMLHDDRQALHIFREGLTMYAQTNYGDFIVPWTKHKGKKIRECRNKSYFEWAVSEESGYQEKRQYDILLTAITNFLDNPHHQGVKRDIGQPLHKYELSDQVNLKGGFLEEGYDTDEKPTTSDEEALDDREEDALSLHSDGLPSRTGETTEEEEEEEEEEDADADVDDGVDEDANSDSGSR